MRKNALWWCAAVPLCCASCAPAPVRPKAVPPAPARQDLVFIGTVTAVEYSPLIDSDLNWIVHTRIDQVLTGRYPGAAFSFRVHSPTTSNLSVGESYRIKADRRPGGYRVDQYQWRKGAAAAPEAVAGAPGESRYVDEGVMKDVEKAAVALADVLGKQPAVSGSIYELLEEYLRNHPYIYGAAFAFAPVEKDGRLMEAVPSVSRKGNSLVKKRGRRYDYRDSPWYSEPVRKKQAVWSTPYLPRGESIWIVTYSVPVYASDKERQLMGVLASDVLPKEAP